MRMRHRLAILAVTVPATAYLLLIGALYAGQGAILFRPDDLVLDGAAVGVPGLRTVRVRTADGLDLAAWFLPPPPGRPVLLYLHGNGGSLAGRTGRARRLAQHGWGLLMLEYRGYGGNAGTPGEDGFAVDALGALAFLAEQGVPSARTVLYGESLGTGVAARLAVERPPAAVVLDSPYTSITDMARLQYPFLPVRWLLRHPFDTLSRIPHIQAPLLVMQGARDTVIPPVMARAVFDAAAGPKEMWVSEQGVHEDVLETGGDAVLASFVARHVPGG